MYSLSVTIVVYGYLLFPPSCVYTFRPWIWSYLGSFCSLWKHDLPLRHEYTNHRYNFFLNISMRPTFWSHSRKEWPLIENVWFTVRICILLAFFKLYFSTWAVQWLKHTITDLLYESIKWSWMAERSKWI